MTHCSLHLISLQGQLNSAVVVNKEVSPACEINSKRILYTEIFVCLNEEYNHTSLWGYEVPGGYEVTRGYEVPGGMK